MKLRKKTNTIEQTTSPNRLGRNTVKPNTDKNSPFNNSPRRIDDFNRPNGYHSSLPNINNQLAPDGHHSNTKSENIFSKTNSSQDLSMLMQKKQVQNKNNKPKKSFKKRAKRLFILVFILIIVAIIIKFLPSLIDLYQKNIG